MTIISTSEQERDNHENPEWTNEMFSRAKKASEITELQSVLKSSRGRPKSEVTKSAVTIRYDQQVLDYFRATGKGWQTRMNEVLKEYVSSH